MEEEEGGMERSVASLSHVMFECLPLLLERRNGLLIEGHQPVGGGRGGAAEVGSRGGCAAERGREREREGGEEVGRRQVTTHLSASPSSIAMATAGGYTSMKLLRVVATSAM